MLSPSGISRQRMSKPWPRVGRSGTTLRMTTAPSWLDAIGQIFHRIPDLAQPEQVQSSLREILEDPTLEIFWWDWESERYVDVHGEEALQEISSRVVTLVDYDTRK